MSDEVSPKSEEELAKAAREAAYREYQETRQRQYDEAMAKLESSSIEPAQRAAYEATLGDMVALPIGELVWPIKDPRYKLHRAMDYGEKLVARRSEIEGRFYGKLPLEQVFSIGRYALAALHAFKHWRANPEPEESFEKLLKDAAHTRLLLRSQASLLRAYNLIGAKELKHFDGGVTPEGVACDLFLLSGVLKDVAPRLKFELLTTPVELMTAELLGKSLLRHATGERYPQLWQPTVHFSRALTLLDEASLHAEIVLSELHNEERDPDEEMEWKPACLFCECEIERQRHHRHNESPKEAQRRAQFISSTMTAALGRGVVQN